MQKHSEKELRCKEKSSNKNKPSPLQFREERFTFKETNFLQGLIDNTFAEQYIEINQFYQQLFGYDIYVLDNQEIPALDKIDSKKMFLSVKGKYVVAYFLINSEFSSIISSSEMVTVKAKLTREEKLILKNKEFIVGGKLAFFTEDKIDEEDSIEKNYETEIINIDDSAEIRENYVRCIQRFILRIVSLALNIDHEKFSSQLREIPSDKDSNFFIEPERKISLNQIINLINDLTEESDEFTIKDLLAYLNSKLIEHFPIHDFYFFQFILMAKAQFHMCIGLQEKFLNLVFEKVLTIPSTEELFEKEKESDEFIPKTLEEISIESTRAALERAYIVSTEKERDDGIEYFGSKMMDICIAVTVRHPGTGTMVNAHISREASIPLSIATILREFESDLDNEGYERVLDLRFQGGNLHDEELYKSVSGSTFKDILFYLLIAAHQSGFKLRIQSADIFYKLDYMRKYHQKITDGDFSVGNLLDRKGRVVFVYYPDIDKYLPLVCQSVTPILREEEHKNIWLTVLSAFQIPRGGLLKMYDDRDHKWNSWFLLESEEKLAIEYIKRLIMASIDAVILKPDDSDLFLIEIIRNTLTGWMDLWRHHFEQIVTDDKKEQFENCPFTYHFMQYITNKIYSGSEFPSPLKREEQECVLFNLIVKSNIIRNIIFDAVHLLCAQLLDKLSEGNINNEMMLELLTEFKVSPWHLYDEIKSYLIKLNDDFPAKDEIWLEDNLIFTLLHNPHNTKELIVDWQKKKLAAEVEKVVNRKLSVIGEFDIELGNFVKSALIGCGVGLLPHLHRLSCVQPSLADLMKSISRIINTNIARDDRITCFGSGAQDIRPKLATLIKEWFRKAGTSDPENIDTIMTVMLDQMKKETKHKDKDKDKEKKKEPDYENNPRGCCALS